MIGKEISPTLAVFEDMLWDWDYNHPDKPYGFTEKGFRAAFKIFTSALSEKTCNLQEEEGMSLEDREKMLLNLVTEIQRLVKVYADVDSVKLYENDSPMLET